MNGFEKMRAFCREAKCCEVEGIECPFEYECNLISGFPFEWTDEDIARLTGSAMDENAEAIIWTEIKTEGEGKEQRLTCRMPEDGQDVLLMMKDGSVGDDVCYADVSEDGDTLYGLESNYDWGDVIAWAQMPEGFQRRAKDE